MTRRRLDTEGATTVLTVRGKDDEAIAALLAPLDDHAGPARRLSSKAQAAMVGSILDAALKAGPLSSTSEASAPGEAAAATAPVRRGPRRTFGLLAAAVVMAAAVGAAAAVFVSRHLDQPAEPEPPATPPAPGPRAPTVAPDPDEPPEIEMEGETVRRPRPDRKPDRDRGERPAPPPDAPAEDVLAAANLRRKQQDWRGAAELYRRVVKSFPGTDAAVVAEVASATLQLDQFGDAAGALRAYRHALATRPRGPLAEEARWGIAEAHRARGDRVAEYAALTDFLRAHPDSALRPAALKRQAELSSLQRGSEPTGTPP